MSNSYEGIEFTEEELTNGYSAEEIFSSAENTGITFDDLISLPGAINFGVHEVDLTVKLTKNITLNHPLSSSPMDTVTGYEMAIGMALNGCIGFLHGNCSIEEQAEMVRKVKNFENGFIVEPAVLPPTALVSDLDVLRKAKKISGVPVTEDGKIGSKLLGIITNRDTDFLENRNVQIRNLMTPIERLVTGRYPLNITEANQILKVSLSF
jgi:IMP dehydrogenase